MRSNHSSTQHTLNGFWDSLEVCSRRCPLLCSKRRQKRQPYRPDSVCNEDVPCLVPHFNFGAAFVICPFFALLVCTQILLHFLHVHFKDFRHFCFAQLLAVLCSNNIRWQPFSHRGEFAPLANVFAGIARLPHRPVLCAIWVMKKDW